MTDIRKIKERRKARWEIVLNPGVTFLILLFLIGLFVVWIGIYERIYHPGEGVVTNYVSNLIASLNAWLESIR
jgi:hypothetical protein